MVTLEIAKLCDFIEWFEFDTQRPKKENKGAQVRAESTLLDMSQPKRDDKFKGFKLNDIAIRVLILRLRAYKIREISKMLGIKPSTVKYHIGRICWLFHENDFNGVKYHFYDYAKIDCFLNAMRKRIDDDDYKTLEIPVSYLRGVNKTIPPGA